MGVDADLFAQVPDLTIKRHAEQMGSLDKAMRRAGYLLASTVGPNWFLIDTPNSVHNEGEHCLKLISDKEYFKLADETECEREYAKGVSLITYDHSVVKVRWLMRFYGEGYERGNWPVIRATAEWLENYFDGAKIYYGPDTDEEELWYFGPNEREAMNKFFLQNGRRDYIHKTRLPDLFGEKSQAPVCPACDEYMAHTGGGGSMRFYCCDGCDYGVIKSLGQEFGLDRGEDFFRAAERLRQQHGIH